MKGTFKVLISVFTEFNSEGISAWSSQIAILFSLMAVHTFTDAPIKFDDALLESVSNSTSEEGGRLQRSLVNN